MSLEPYNSNSGEGSNSVADAITQLNAIARALGRWVQAWSSRTLTGSFTMTATATLSVSESGVTSNSVVVPVARNAAAAALMSSTAYLYVATISPGVGFTVATANGAAAAGTEQFQYTVTTPA